jgi:alkylation response protein AidB-like acyl-CoA dehydrogenase
VTYLDLTEEEELLTRAARQYFAAFVDNTYLNQQERSGPGYEGQRWKEMGALGWTAINVPERAGGAGGTLAAAALVARECGRAALASPLLQSMRAATVLVSLGDPEFDDTLSHVAHGQPTALVAPPDGPLVAERTGNRQYRLTGRRVVVEWLAQSESAVVLAPIRESDRWLCSVVRRQQLDGCLLEVPSTDNERVCLFDPQGLELSAGVLADGLAARRVEVAMAQANLLRASSMVGGCAAVLELSRGYALERVQFGQPIGAFQAVRHHLARMAIAADAAVLTCNDALGRAAGEPETAMAAVALFTAGRSYVESVLTGAQLHGGIGTTVDHVLHHHFRRAKAMQLRCGKRANRLREIHAALVCRREGSLW